jgi:hypothetical protein
MPRYIKIYINYANWIDEEEIKRILKDKQDSKEINLENISDSRLLELLDSEIETTKDIMADDIVVSYNDIEVEVVEG